MKRRLAIAATAVSLPIAASAIRGSGSGNTLNYSGNSKKKHRQNNNNVRPPVQDANQGENIRNWHKRQLEELCGEDGCWQSMSIHEQQHQQQGQGLLTEQRQRQLAAYTSGAHHKKKKNYGHAHAEKTPDLGFQQKASSSSSNIPPPSASPPAASPDTMQLNSAAAATTTSTTTNLYYPLYTSSRTIGTCSNNGNEPQQYHNPNRSSNFLFTSMDTCCFEWYVDVAGCKLGFAHASEDDGGGQLLKRNWVTGERIDGKNQVRDEWYDQQAQIDMNSEATTNANTNSKADKQQSQQQQQQPQQQQQSSSGGSSASGFASPNAKPPSNTNSNIDTIVANAAKAPIPDAAPNPPQPHSKNNNSNNSNNNNYQYYPSFNMALYPHGACLNDGNHPSDYKWSYGKYLFDEKEDCCQEWFLRVDQCLEAEAIVAVGGGVSSSSSGNQFVGAQPQMMTSDAKNNDTPTPTPYIEMDDTTPWPTWFEEDDTDSGNQGYINDNGGATTSWPTWSNADTIQSNNIGAKLPNHDTEPASFSSNNNGKGLGGGTHFFESFESGNFNSYDWALLTHTPPSSSTTQSSDKWEADRTALAYHGNYAARPGILSVPGAQSNLTISLEGLDVTTGGLLSFAIHAAVEMPMDVIYFTINDQVIRTFDSVTGDDAGDWAEVSVVLLPGEHQLTWSYQYFGMTGVEEWEDEFGREYDMDLRRMGNSWVDAISLQAFTGDVSISDGGNDAYELLEQQGGSSGWGLISDPGAFEGSHSYIAYTQDINGNSGSEEISWTIVAGPEGGILSFALFSSTYAPHDVLEFAVNGVPQIAMTTPSSGWEQKYIEIEPGAHTVKWRLVKNPPGLSANLLEATATPEGYQGYAKVDSIVFMDNQVHQEVVPTTTTTTSTSTTTTSTTTSTTTTTTTSTTTTEEPTTTSTTTSTTEEPTTTTEATTTTTSTTTTEEEEEPATTEAPQTTTTTPEMSEKMAPGVVYTTCPEGTQSVEGLPNCCLEEPNYLGDGACDPWGPYNTEECAFDLGDCCYETCNHDSPYGCDTKEGEAEYGPFGFFCIDPRFGIIDESKCEIENREWIGDGGCDAEGGYNTEECGWDMGDCCEDDCNAEYSFYPCGANQPFSCDNPHLTQTGPSGSAVYNTQDPFYFHDGFEANVFDPLRWRWMDGQGVWEIEHEDAEAPAIEGVYYAEALTEDILDDLDTAELELKVNSPNGGTLSYEIQALIQAPFEDVLIEVDGVAQYILMDAISTWQTQTLDIDAGEHKIKWVVRKNPSDASDEDLAMSTPNLGITRVDDVTFIPN